MMLPTTELLTRLLSVRLVKSLVHTVKDLITELFNGAASYSTYPTPLHEVRDHYYDSTVLLPDHSPEVGK